MKVGKTLISSIAIFLIATCLHLPVAPAADSATPLDPAIPTSDPQSAALAVLSQAEGLGLPTMSQGTLFLASTAAADGSTDTRFQLNLRLPDGSWLIDLVTPMTAADLPAERTANWRQVANRSGLAWDTIVLPAGERPPRALAIARQLALGRPWAETLLAIPEEMRAAEFLVPRFPRRPARLLLVSDLRIACADALLGDPRNAAADRLAAVRTWIPAADQPAARWLRLRLAPEPPAVDDPAAAKRADLLASAASTWWHTRPVGPWPSPMVAHDLEERDLAAFADCLEPAPGHPGLSIGDLALSRFMLQTGCDPSCVALRSSDAIWSDAEQTAVATGLRDFLARGDWTARLTWLAGRADAHALRVVLEGRAQRTFGKRDGGDSTTVGPVWLARHPHGPPAGTAPADLDWLLVRFATSPQGAAGLAAWPTDGPLGSIISLYQAAAGDDEAAYDAALPRWLADLPGIPNSNFMPLARWLQKPNPARWRLLTDACSAALTHGSARLLILAAGRRMREFLPAEQQGGESAPVPGAWPLALSCLLDQRELPDAWPETRRPSGGNPFVTVAPSTRRLRVCDLASNRIRTDLLLALSSRPSLRERFGMAPPPGDPTAKEAMLEDLRKAIAPRACDVLAQAGIPVPAEWSRYASAAADQSAPASLTAAEAELARTLVQQAVADGFPDPATSQACNGNFAVAMPANRLTEGIEGPLLHLPDGSWLVGCVAPGRIDRSDSAPQKLIPQYAGNFASWNAARLDAAAMQRIGNGKGLVDPFAWKGEVWRGTHVWVGLQWWLDQQDAEGELLVAGALALTVEAPEPGATRFERGLRRGLGEWFLAQLAISDDGERCRLMGDAARRMFPADDQPTIQARIGAYEQRKRSPPDRLAMPPLTYRLALQDAHSPDCPPATDREFLTAAASDGIAAALRSGQIQWIADLAYDAWLEQRHWDVRWAVADDPEVVACLGKPVDGTPAWNGAKWNATARKAVAAALARWFAEHPDERSQGRALARALPADQVVAGAAHLPEGVLAQLAQDRLLHDPASPTATALAILGLAEEPANERLLATIRQAPAPARLIALQQALSTRDPAAALRIVADDIASGDPQRAGSDLGLLAHSGSYTALVRLREMAAGNPDESTPVIGLIGHAYWPVAGSAAAGQRVWLRQEVAMAIPVYLAWEALADQRPYADPAPGLTWSSRSANRVCDSVARRLMDHLAELQIPPFTLPEPPPGQQRSAFEARLPDDVLTALRAHLVPVVREFYDLAGWAGKEGSK